MQILLTKKLADAMTIKPVTPNEETNPLFSWTAELDKYRNDRYIPYALLYEGKAVANVSANILDFYVIGEMKRYIQIGTVMTDIAYRNRGLCKYLMERVIGEWQDKSDLIYLFANDSVLDFYPKFGFVRKPEYQ